MSEATAIFMLPIATLSLFLLFGMADMVATRAAIRAEARTRGQR